MAAASSAARMVVVVVVVVVTATPPYDLQPWQGPKRAASHGPSAW